MPKGKPNPKINSALLNTLITELYDNKSEFAREYRFKIYDIGNWTHGVANPSEYQIKRLAKILDCPVEVLMLPGDAYITKGWQAGLTRWAYEHINNKRETMRDSDALAIINATTPESLEEVDDETEETEFTVQGPS